MKKLTFILFITAFIILYGCTSLNTNDLETNVTGPPPEVIEFSSLDRFLDTYKNGGLVHIGIDSTMEFYLPAIVPDGFELYSIAASNDSVRFSYLPEEHTDSIWSIRDAQNNDKHFALWYTLPNVETPRTIENLFEQFDATERDLINGKYLFYRPSNFFWVENEASFSISLPTEMITPFYSALRDENIDGMEMMSYDGFSEILNFLRVELIR